MKKRMGDRMERWMEEGMENRMERWMEGGMDVEKEKMNIESGLDKCCIR